MPVLIHPVLRVLHATAASRFNQDHKNSSPDRDLRLKSDATDAYHPGMAGKCFLRQQRKCAACKLPPYQMAVSNGTSQRVAA